MLSVVLLSVMQLNVVAQQMQQGETFEHYKVKLSSILKVLLMPPKLLIISQNKLSSEL
jgi:hypothetical protein